MDSLKVGQIVNVHGIKGEIKVYPYTNDVENLAKEKSIYLDSALTKECNILSRKTIKNMIVFQLEGVDTVEKAKEYISQFIYIAKKKITQKDTYYIQDLIGFDVYTKEGHLGKLTYIYQTGSSDIYEIKTQTDVIYLPAIKQVVNEIDLEHHKIVVTIMEGLV